MGDQNQDGGTSTPGKRPGCSVHVLSLKNARLAKPHSLLPYHASPRTPMDYGSLDYANYIQLCRITTSRSTVFISSPYHHLALSPAASCQQRSIHRYRGSEVDSSSFPSGFGARPRLHECRSNQSKLAMADGSRGHYVAIITASIQDSKDPNISK